MIIDFFVKDFITWLNDLGKNDDNTVFYRETAAQHWNHTGIGYFDDEKRLESNGTCVPLSDATPGKRVHYSLAHEWTSSTTNISSHFSLFLHTQ
jgi:hypothetical protein